MLRLLLPPPNPTSGKTSAESSTAASEDAEPAEARGAGTKECCWESPPEALFEKANPCMKFTLFSRRLCCCSAFVMAGMSLASRLRKSPFSLPITKPTSLA